MRVGDREGGDAEKHGGKIFLRVAASRHRPLNLPAWFRLRRVMDWQGPDNRGGRLRAGFETLAVVLAQTPGEFDIEGDGETL